MGWIIGIVLAFVTLLIYGCCVASGKSSRHDEEMETMYQLNTMLNDNVYARENVTVDDCDEVCNKYNLRVELNDGVVTRFVHV
jgi:hypothetical protein